jgi:hypothetical protein
MQDNEISIEALANVTGGAGLGNLLRAGAVAGMGLVTGEEGPKYPRLEPQGQTTSSGGGSLRAPFQPLQILGGGTATFGQ